MRAATVVPALLAIWLAFLAACVATRGDTLATGLLAGAALAQLLIAVKGGPPP